MTAPKGRAEPMKPCPFCGGAAELDARQGYTYAKYGQPRHGTAVAVYCTECTVQISVCREDVPDIASEAVIEMWNRRAEVEASRLPLAGAATSDERFFLDHGMWHDRVTGQHLYTEDQYSAATNEAWAAVEAAGVKRDGWVSLPEAIAKLAPSPAPSDAAVQQPVAVLTVALGLPLQMLYHSAAFTLPEGRHQLYTSPLPTGAPCDHVIADARNKAVQSGYVCLKCNAIFAAAAPMERIAPLSDEEIRRIYWTPAIAGSEFADGAEKAIALVRAIEAEHGITLAQGEAKGDGK